MLREEVLVVARLGNLVAARVSAPGAKKLEADEPAIAFDGTRALTSTVAVGGVVSMFCFSGEKMGGPESGKTLRSV
jgi:hypothetical protein